MKLRKEIIVIISLLGIICAGCSGNPMRREHNRKLSLAHKFLMEKLLQKTQRKLRKKCMFFHRRIWLLHPA